MTGYLCRNTWIVRFFVGKEMHMNYEKLAGSIRAVIDRRPEDSGAYSDLFIKKSQWSFLMNRLRSDPHPFNRQFCRLTGHRVAIIMLSHAVSGI